MSDQKSIEYMLGELNGKMDTVVASVAIIGKEHDDLTRSHKELDSRVTVIETRTKTALSIFAFILTLLVGSGVYFQYHH